MIIAATNLNKSLGYRRVLTDVSLRVREGEGMWIRGGNGAGKSTLLSCLAGLLRLDSGQITLFAEKPRTRRSAAVGDCRVGYAAQAYSFIYPLLSPRENLQLMAELTRSAPRRVDFLLNLFGMQWFADQRSFTLSEGMRRRLMLARALVSSPKLLLLDEPTAGLDNVGVEQLSGFLTDFRRDGGTTVLVSHDERFSAIHSDSQAELVKGQMTSE